GRRAGGRGGRLTHALYVLLVDVHDHGQHLARGDLFFLFVGGAILNVAVRALHPEAGAQVGSHEALDLLRGPVLRQHFQILRGRPSAAALGRRLLALSRDGDDKRRGKNERTTNHTHEASRTRNNVNRSQLFGGGGLDRRRYDADEFAPLEQLAP